MSDHKVPLPELPAELEAFFGPAGSYKPGSDDDHVAFISIAEMQDYAIAHGDAREKAGWNAAIAWAAAHVKNREPRYSSYEDCIADMIAAIREGMK